MILTGPADKQGLFLGNTLKSPFLAFRDKLFRMLVTFHFPERNTIKCTDLILILTWI